MYLVSLPLPRFLKFSNDISGMSHSLSNSILSICSIDKFRAVIEAVTRANSRYLRNKTKIGDNNSSFHEPFADMTKKNAFQLLVSDPCIISMNK